MSSVPPIIVVWPEYPPAVGGMQVHGFEFARFLRASAVPFVLVTRKPDTPERAREAAAFDGAAGIPVRRVLPHKRFADTLDVISSLTRALQPRAAYCSQIAYAPAFQRRTRVVCRSAGNDVLRPWVGPCDVTSRRIASLPEAEGIARVEKNAEWVRQAAADCDVVLCNSEWTAVRLRSLLSVPVTVVRGGVDVHRFRPLTRERLRPYLTWAGQDVLALIAARHVVKKGVDVALDAIKLLAPGLKLIVAGRGPETCRLMAQQNRLKLADRVRFVGPIDHDHLPWLLAMADVVLAPSRSVYDPRRFGTDHETMCRVACEAAACGTPVIASASGGLPEIVLDRQTGLLVPPCNSGALAEAIHTLASDVEQRRALAVRARERAIRELSFDRVNRETLSWLTRGLPVRPEWACS